MDTQLKRGVLDALVLSTLLKADSYGYQIIKDISPHTTLSESTLYPHSPPIRAQRLSHHLQPGARLSSAEILQHHPPGRSADPGFFVGMGVYYGALCLHQRRV